MFIPESRVQIIVQKFGICSFQIAKPSLKGQFTRWVKLKGKKTQTSLSIWSIFDFVIKYHEKFF